MAFLAVRHVRYEGDRYHYTSPYLKDGVNILVGPNGSGKSTFSSLIYYGLGGDVESFRKDRSKQHKEVLTDHNNYVELQVEIDGNAFTFTRYIQSNDVAVTTGEQIAVLPIFRPKDGSPIFSDWLLAKLNIEPVHIQFGAYSWQMNIRDLMRLIYHNQAPDPSDVYKAPDTETNFVVDSRVMRKAIFEILAGKSFQEYYEALAKFRDLEKQRGQLSGTLELFKQTMAELQRGRVPLNTIFIDKQIGELKSRLDQLLSHRRSLVASESQGVGTGLHQKKQELLAVELNEADTASRESDLIQEKTRLQKVRESLILEATQIKKMVFAHEQLQLFSANTCPYCLRDVARTPHHCVCGAKVDEKDYERFFYEADEYLKILKSKQRNVNTIELAISACDEEIERLKLSRSRLQNSIEEIRESIKREVGDIGLAVDLSKFEEVDTVIAQIRAEVSVLEQQRELQAKLEDLEKRVANVKTAFETAKGLSESLGHQAEQEMLVQRNSFSEKYNELMKETVKDCSHAAIDSDYLPVINGGEYKEASSAVARRLMYYTTLLYLAKNNPSIRFPRFLLVDTPDTAGIDEENLINTLSKLIATATATGAVAQVILTTGEGKYPPENESDVFARLTKQNPLLVPRESSQSITPNA